MCVPANLVSKVLKNEPLQLAIHLINERQQEACEKARHSPSQRLAIRFTVRKIRRERHEMAGTIPSGEHQIGMINRSRHVARHRD